ncbi:glycosyltransferase family 2 protein [Alkalibacillus almallahensis]|uniref:glycosyltransferase family 2 protein n=1 Tax=Alkalibacillus almallahensis TaxID=1379154 RepID=UPI00141DDE72|nr:glycosyltransferase family 2 protein [Alkalibacillus almallahensis]NIK11819.1 teichuronic acid biosynthesis glycosyltransferase TuaG [Alkalibacillus almallahensis]
MLTENKEKTPIVSVITPTYNSEQFIAETIESVIKQSFSNWEMVIVDDCSSDSTVDIIKQYQMIDSRIKLYELDENSGAAVARNKSIRNANGRYLAFLDSDDLWYPEKLEKQLAFMEKNDLAFSFTKYQRMRLDGTLTNNISKTPKSVGYHDLMKHCIIGCLTVMLDRQKIDNIEMKNIRRRQDYALWLTITRKGYRAYGLPEILAKYRLGQNTVSSNKFKAAKGQWYVYRQIEKKNLLISSYYFLHYTFHGLHNALKSKMKINER